MKFFLLPFAWLFHLVILLRHKLFDWRILKSSTFRIPVICVGNLTVGGTGKTPHIEYLIRLFQDRFQVAVLSRGYGRQSKGFLVATADTTASQIGDEPRQYSLKYPKATVAVHERRVKGIQLLLENEAKPNLILLDDAFQHRYVKAGLNILLTDYHHLYTDDYLLPVGRLRDTRSSAQRAQAIVVTKMPHVFSPFIEQDLVKKIQPLPHQTLFFSYFKYGNYLPVFNQSEVFIPKNISSILLVTGIANVYPLKEHLLGKCTDLVELSYPDHHHYTENDLQKISETFHDILGKSKIILTTEKDAVRFKDSEYLRILEKLPVFYIPIKVAFHKSKGISFDEYIEDYVKKNR